MFGLSKPPCLHDVVYWFDRRTDGWMDVPPWFPTITYMIFCIHGWMFHLVYLPYLTWSWMDVPLCFPLITYMIMDGCSTLFSFHTLHDAVYWWMDGCYVDLLVYTSRFCFQCYHHLSSGCSCMIGAQRHHCTTIIVKEQISHLFLYKHTTNGIIYLHSIRRQP